jgi:hypothetical protein
MEQMTNLFEEFLLKAIEITESALTMDYSEGTRLDAFTENRDRLYQIIEQISGQVDWDQVDGERKAFLSKQIDYIKKLDEQLLTKLQEYRETLKTDIEKTCRQKDNIKGYNLNDVK